MRPTLEPILNVAPLQIPVAYDRTIVQKLWRALRCERQLFSSRDEFINHMSSTIMNKTEHLRFIFKDGSNCNVPEAPSPDTIERFIDSIDESLAPQPSVKPWKRALIFSHIYLWCRKPKLVESWSKNCDNLFLQDFIDNLDNTFNIVIPSDIFPEIFYLRHLNDEGDFKGRVNEILRGRHINPKHWQSCGLFYLDRRNFKNGSKIFHISDADIKIIKDAYVDGHVSLEMATFDSSRPLMVGLACAIQSKDFYFEGYNDYVQGTTSHFEYVSHYKVGVDKNSFIVVMRFSNNQPSESWGYLKIADLDGFMEWINDGYMSSKSDPSTRGRLPYGKKDGEFLPMPLNQNEKEYFISICNFYRDYAL